MKVNWQNLLSGGSHLALIVGNSYLLHKNPTLGAAFAPAFQYANAVIPSAGSIFDIETNKVTLPQTTQIMEDVSKIVTQAQDNATEQKPDTKTDTKPPTKS